MTDDLIEAIAAVISVRSGGSMVSMSNRNDAKAILVKLKRLKLKIMGRPKNITLIAAWDAVPWPGETR